MSSDSIHVQCCRRQSLNRTKQPTNQPTNALFSVANISSPNTTQRSASQRFWAAPNVTLASSHPVRFPNPICFWTFMRVVEPSFFPPGFFLPMQPKLQNLDKLISPYNISATRSYWQLNHLTKRKHQTGKENNGETMDQSTVFLTLATDYRSSIDNNLTATTAPRSGFARCGAITCKIQPKLNDSRSWRTIACHPHSGRQSHFARLPACTRKTMDSCKRSVPLVAGALIVATLSQWVINCKPG